MRIKVQSNNKLLQSNRWFLSGIMGKVALMAACESVEFSAEEIFNLKLPVALKRMKVTALKMKF